ncbi:hypothetical protein V1273_001383 [Bradyrhizobium sp. AZCC 1721]
MASASGNVAAGLADDDGEFALPIQMRRHLRPDHRRVVADLGTPHPQEDRRKRRDLTLHAVGHRLLMMVEIVADSADDLFGTRDHRKVFDVGELQVGLVAGHETIALLEIGACNEVLQRGVGQLAAEVDHAIADDRSPGLPAIVQK